MAEEKIPGLGDVVKTVANLALYQQRVAEGKTSNGVIYLVLAERKVFFNGEDWTEGGGSNAVIFDVASSDDPWNLNALETQTTVAKITEAITNNSPIYMRFGVALVAVAEAYLYRNGDISLYANVVDYESLIVRSIHTYAVDETTWAWEYFDTPIGGTGGGGEGGSNDSADSESEEVIAAAFNDMNKRMDADKASFATKKALADEVAILVQEIEQREEVTAAALADLDTRIRSDRNFLEQYYLTSEGFTEYMDNLIAEIQDNERVIAAALSDINARLESLSNS